MTLEIPTELIDSLQSNQVVLFVGHDFDTTESDIPSEASLVNELAKQSSIWECAVQACNKAHKCIQPNECCYSLSNIATIYEQKSDRNHLIRFLKDRLDSSKLSLSARQSLMQLPVRTIVTTAYDKRFEAAYRDAGIRCHSVSSDIEVGLSESEGVQVIHLYGELSQHESLVLTEDEHEQVIEVKKSIARTLQHYLTTQNCLFIDLDFKNAYLRALYRKTINELGGWQRIPYILTKHPKQQPLEAYTLPYNPSRFLGVLSQKLLAISKTTAQVNSPRKLPPLSIPVAPYKFLDHFTSDDRAIFVGRDEEVKELTLRILSHRITVLYGYSGMGKTSLLQAGVVPNLHLEGFEVRSLRLSDNPLDSLQASIEEMSFAASQSPTIGHVLILDQAEELFTVVEESGVRQACVDVLLAAINDQSRNFHVLFSLRIEYLGRLEALFNRDVLSNRFRLGPLGREQARQAILKPVSFFQVSYEEKLVGELLDYLEIANFDPSYLQIICFQLYQDLMESQPEKNGLLTFARYEELGKAEQILGGFLDKALATIENETQDSQIQTRIQTILKNMVTIDRTKIALHLEELTKRTTYALLDAEDIHHILYLLQQQRIIRGLEDGRYELSHDVLIPKIWAWMDDIDIARLNAAHLLSQAIYRYDTYDALIGIDEQVAIAQAAETLTIDSKGLVLLLISSIATNNRKMAQKWINQIDNYEENVLVQITVAVPKLNLPSHLKLAKELIRHLSREELEDLCFHLHIDYENLQGSTKSSKVRELILYLAHRRRSVELVKMCQKIYPFVPSLTVVEEIYETAPEQFQVSKPKTILEYIREAQSSQHLEVRESAFSGEILAYNTLFAQVAHSALIQYFRATEIQHICLQMDIDFEQLAGTGRRSKARELVLISMKSSSLDKLIAIIRDERPQLAAISRLAMPAPSPNESVILVRLLDRAFNFDELVDLCRYLELNLHSLGLRANAKLNSIRTLVTFLRRQNRLDHLRLAIFNFRPHIQDIEIKVSYFEDILKKRFDIEQLRTLCFDLGIDYEDFPSLTKQDIVTGVVQRMMRDRSESQLIKAIIFPDRAGEGRYEIALRRRIETTDEDMFRSLCFSLHIKFSNLSGSTVSAKSRELIRFVQRHNRLGDLIFTLMKERIISEDEVWQKIREAYADQGLTQTLLGDMFGWQPDKSSESKAVDASIQNIDAYLLERLYDSEETYWMCLELGVDYEDLEADTLQAKQLELIRHLERQNRLKDLVSYIAATRPHSIPNTEGLFDEEE